MCLTPVSLWLYAGSCFSYCALRHSTCNSSKPGGQRKLLLITFISGMLWSNQTRHITSRSLFALFCLHVDCKPVFLLLFVLSEENVSCELSLNVKILYFNSQINELVHTPEQNEPCLLGVIWATMSSGAPLQVSGILCGVCVLSLCLFVC